MAKPIAVYWSTNVRGTIGIVLCELDHPTKDDTHVA